MNMNKGLIFSCLFMMLVAPQLQARPNVTNDPTDPNDWCNMQRESLNEELSKAKTASEKKKIKEEYRKNTVISRFCGGVG